MRAESTHSEEHVESMPDSLVDAGRTEVRCAFSSEREGCRRTWPLLEEGRPGPSEEDLWPLLRIESIVQQEGTMGAFKKRERNA